MIHDRLPEHVRERHRRRPDLPRDELEEIVEELVEFIETLTEAERRSIHVQVVITDSQKVLLHAQETNAAGEPINRDTATAVWTSDRQDVVTLEPNADDPFSAWAIRVGGGATGDTLATVTLTEPGTDDGQGGTTPGKTYVGVQVVTVNVDQTIAAVEITADAPVPA